MLSFDGELDSELTGILHDEYKGRLGLTIWVLHGRREIKIETWYSDDHYLLSVRTTNLLRHAGYIILLIRTESSRTGGRGLGGVFHHIEVLHYGELNC